MRPVDSPLYNTAVPPYLMLLNGSPICPFHLSERDPSRRSKPSTFGTFARALLSHLPPTSLNSKLPCMPPATRELTAHPTVPPSLSMPSFTVPMPPLISTLFAHFPLVTYPALPPLSPAPTLPTLWLLGPPPIPSPIPSPSDAQDLESLDPACREAQALARFHDIVVSIRWFSHPSGAVSERLPNLHLPNGALLNSSEVSTYFSNPTAFDSPPVLTKVGENEKEPTHQAYASLVRTTLAPSIQASIYLSPPLSSLPISPMSPLPLLSSLATYVLALSSKKEKIEEVKKMRGGRVGVRSMLDLEELEREGVETIKAVEVKMGIDGGDWFGGASYVSLSLSFGFMRMVLMRSVGNRRGWTRVCMRYAVSLLYYLVHWRVH